MIFIFDIDGTLANINHRVHHVRKTPKDWDGFFKDMADDKPISEMVDLAIFLFRHEADIYLLTGREEIHYTVTDKWLLDNGVFYDRLIMRKRGDRRPDYITKIEALNGLSDYERESIVTIFEDRKSVVDAMRENGYHVCQVADGNF